MTFLKVVKVERSATVASMPRASGRIVEIESSSEAERHWATSYTRCGGIESLEISGSGSDVNIRESGWSAAGQGRAVRERSREVRRGARAEETARRGFGFSASEMAAGK